MDWVGTSGHSYGMLVFYLSSGSTPTQLIFEFFGKKLKSNLEFFEFKKITPDKTPP
jgi:hypothetical protein